MAEISNSTLALLVLVTLGVVVLTTVTSINTLQRFTGITGFATSDTGNVSLTINSTVAIQVHSGNRSIDFGTCSPRGGTSYSCVTNDTIACDNVALNCSGDTATPQFIRVDNIGNIDVNITTYSSCTAAQLIGGTGPGFSFIATACNGTGVSSWTSFPTSGSPALACTNLSFRGGQLQVYANVTIPQDAAPSGCAGGISVITFTAAQIP